MAGVMDRVTNLFVLGILLVFIGGLVTIISFAMLPTIVQASNDLVNEDISGVSLTTSQENLVSNNTNIIILMFLYIGVIVLIVGFVLLLVEGFKGTGK